MAGVARQAGDADSSRAPGLTSGLQGSVNVHRGSLLLVPQWQYIGSFVFYILSHLFPLPCGAGSTVPHEGLDSSVIMPFPDVLWLWHFRYCVGPHPVSRLHIFTFVVSRAFMAGAASQAGDADSSRAPGLTSGLQGPWMSTVVLYCWCHSDSASVLLYFTFKLFFICHFLWLTDMQNWSGFNKVKIGFGSVSFLYENNMPSFSVSSVLSVCPTSWYEHNGNCYFFSTQGYRYSDALIVCSQRNASLLVYRDDSDWVSTIPWYILVMLVSWSTGMILIGRYIMPVFLSEGMPLIGWVRVNQI